MSAAFWVQLRRELSAFLFSPLAYVLLFLFSLVTAAIFWVNVLEVARGPQLYGIMQRFFLSAFYWFCIVTLIPVITMRLFSEEYRAGTIEMLLTAPVLEWDIVLAKFFAGVFMYILLWAPTAIYFLAFQVITDFTIPVQWAALGLCYLMVLLIGMFYVSVGVFASSLSSNQIISAVITFTFISLMLFLPSAFTQDADADKINQVRYFFSPYHMWEFARGTFDTRPVIFHLSGTMLFLTLTYGNLISRKFKS
ncbi:MAG: ABC transporter permease subunit [Verrucomicrobiota bacterium]